MKNARGIFCLAIPFVLLFSGCGKIGAIFAPLPKPDDKDFTLNAKVRDFKEGSAATKDGTHPMFNQTFYTCDPTALGVNTVAENLATNQAADQGFAGDSRGPVLLDPLPPQVSGCFSPADRFGDWYQDKGPDVNRSFIIQIGFSFDKGSGTYGYHNLKFFPIDNGGSYSKERGDGPDIFGHLQTGVKDEVDLTKHNYGFTMEAHAKFTYRQGSNQFFTVLADDDFWLFINDKRAIDLGGMHAALRDTVYLDQVKDYLGLVDKTEYPIDFFFAERAVASSKLWIDTNVPMGQ